MTTDDTRRPLSVGLLRSRLQNAQSPWSSVDVLAETGSTNAHLLTYASQSRTIDGAVVIAERQTAGRGRNGRTWSTVPGAQVSMSVGVNIADIPTAGWGWIPLVTGLAVLDALAGTGVSVGLKWPNDVLARPPASGKLAGILVEVASPAPSVVIGVGINVSVRGDELPDPGATSLTLLGSDSPDRAELIITLLRSLSRRLDGLRSRPVVHEEILAEYSNRSLTIGSRVRVVLPGGREIEGNARSVDVQGRLVIDTDGGSVVVSAGDVLHLRPV